jgi:hypothetical protein
MIALIGVQTYRNESAQNNLQAQLDQIQKNTARLPEFMGSVPQSTPPQIIANPKTSAPLRHNPESFLQLGKIQVLHMEIVRDSVMSVNIHIENKSPVPAYHTYRTFAAGMGRLGDDPNKTDQQVHDYFLKRSLAEQRDTVKTSKGVTVGIGETIWNTLDLDPLTQEQVDGYISGRMRFYIYVWARWEGNQRDLDVCRWIQYPGTQHVPDGAELVMHDCWE